MRALAEVCQACYDSGHPFSGLYLLLLYEGSTRLSGPLTQKIGIWQIYAVRERRETARNELPNLATR